MIDAVKQEYREVLGKIEVNTQTFRDLARDVCLKYGVSLRTSREYLLVAKRALELGK